MMLTFIYPFQKSLEKVEKAGFYSCRLTSVLVLAWAMFVPIVVKGQSSYITMEFYNDSQVRIREKIYFRLNPINYDGVSEDSVCIISLPSNVYIDKFEIQIKGGEWEIYKPKDGKFSNTKKDEVKKIFLRRIDYKNTDNVAGKFDDITKSLDKNTNELSGKLDSTNAQIGLINKKLDDDFKNNNNLIIANAKKEEDLKKREADLTTKEQKLKDTLWKSIDTIVYNYLSRVDDYKNEFKFLSESLFYDGNAVSELNRRIRMLDQPYEALNKNYNSFIRQVKDHYSTDVYVDTRDYLNELLNGFHNAQLKDDGNKLFSEMGKYLNGAKGAKRKKDLQDEMKDYISMLTKRHLELSEKFEKLRKNPEIKSK